MQESLPIIQPGTKAGVSRHGGLQLSLLAQLRIKGGRAQQPAEGSASRLAAVLDPEEIPPGDALELGPLERELLQRDLPAIEQLEVGGLGDIS